jgi:AraC family transcriptional regulator, regulatory protein of adaptative response / methylated-DNA-[protein]-cysteine methyltransferase
MTTTTEDHVNYARVEKAIQFLSDNFRQQPELDLVAEKASLSPFHFQRIFTEWAGISPKRFLQVLTVEFLKGKLAETSNMIEAAEKAGLSGQSRVHDLFTTLEAVTPQEHKSHGTGLLIDYGFHETPFGMALIGVTERGICWLSFLQADQDPRAELNSMKDHWHNSTFHEDTTLTQSFSDKVFHRQPGDAKLHVLVKGTNFQVKVWEALLRLPMGNVTTYQNLAVNINNPRALQAVGSAVGSNHVAYLIPCHRVIRKDGVLGEYRWHPIRKKAMIGWELGRGL